MRIPSFTLGILLSLTLTSGSASAFSDVSNRTPEQEAIRALQEQGVLEGYSDGTFRPASAINRAEFLKIVLEARESNVSQGSGCFPDVGDQWYAPYVCSAKASGIIAGYPDGLFRPEREINFVEASKILSLVYDQPIDGSEPTWYVPYVKALESAHAIPPSIVGLEHRMSRGEMAEIMWRIAEEKTDQPSIGYMKVKYPEISVSLSGDVPEQARTCADLSALLKENAEGGGRGMGLPTMMRESDGAAQDVAAPQAKTANGDFTGTNIQVAGVDEGDIVKTDGTYLYAITNGKVHIIRAVPADDLKDMSTISYGEGEFSPSDLYISGDRLVVLGMRWGGGGPVRIMEKMMAPSIWPGPASTERSEVRIYDLRNRTRPELQRKVSFEGSLVSSRLIEDRLTVVVQNTPWYRPIPLAQENDVLPRFSDSEVSPDEVPVARCADVTILPDHRSSTYLTAAVIPVQTDAEIRKDVVLGNGETVYASPENLYVTSTEWNYVWDAVNPASSEHTNIYRFSYADDGITFAAKGEVPGRILNQFSLDEHEGTFRIATTRGNSWDTGSADIQRSALYVLDHDMDLLGSIEDIAPGERIYSTRFIGDRAYMVTFRNIDPLFVISLSDPRSPKILGKLKIPGYSDYLHPFDDHHIIGFGKEAVEAKDDGSGRENFAWYQGMKIALFDVADVENPKELWKTVIGDRGTESPLLHNHKALLFDPERSLLAFPVSVARIPDAQKTPDGSAYGTPVFQGAYLYRLTIEKGFELQGTITHYEDDTFTKAGDVWYGYGKDIERVIRIGENIFTLSPDRVQSNALEDVREIDRLPFPKTEPIEDIIY